MAISDGYLWQRLGTLLDLQLGPLLPWALKADMVYTDQEAEGRQ